MEVSNLFVCLMGMGVTFIGLISLIGLMTIMSKLVQHESAPAPDAVSDAPPADEIPNRQELIAAISAALAEELGTDISGIRILSLRKIS